MNRLKTCLALTVLGAALTLQPAFGHAERYHSDKRPGYDMGSRGYGMGMMGPGHGMGMMGPGAGMGMMGPGHGMGMHGGVHGMGMMAEYLELSDEQLEKMLDLRRKMQGEHEDLMLEMWQLRRDMHGQMLEQGNEKEMERMIDRHTQLMGDMMKQSLQFRKEMFKILNEKQKEKLQEFRHHRWGWNNDD